MTDEKLQDIMVDNVEIKREYLEMLRQEVEA